MSLMSWLSSKKRNASEPAQAGSQRKPARAGGNPASASARRKGERAARRELLYTVVREAMVRAGVLSASYKFKVLSLDTEGRQFLIMMDLAQSTGRDAGNLSEIEALIAQSAKARHNLLVTAVYWRINDHVSVGRADARHSHRQVDSQPAALDSEPAPLDSAPQPLVVVAAAARGPAYEPIQAAVGNAGSRHSARRRRQGARASQFHAADRLRRHGIAGIRSEGSAPERNPVRRDALNAELSPVAVFPRPVPAIPARRTAPVRRHPAAVAGCPAQPAGRWRGAGSRSAPRAH
jgi:hypothetical protein